MVNTVSALNKIERELSLEEFFFFFLIRGDIEEFLDKEGSDQVIHHVPWTLAAIDWR